MNTRAVAAYLEMIRTYDFGVEVPLTASFNWLVNLICDHFPEFAPTLQARLADPQFKQILKMCFDGRPAIKDTFELKGWMLADADALLDGLDEEFVKLIRQLVFPLLISETPEKRENLATVLLTLDQELTTISKQGLPITLMSTKVHTALIASKLVDAAKSASRARRYPMEAAYAAASLAATTVLNPASTSTSSNSASSSPSSSSSSSPSEPPHYEFFLFFLIFQHR